MKRNESKALARIKRIYNSQSEWYYNKLKKFANWVSLDTIKRCESITDFLDNVKYAKLLKKTRVPFRSKMRQLECHYENKRKRKEAKKQIQEGIEEYNTRYDETCGNCEFFETPQCKDTVYKDNNICEDFRD